MCFPIFWAKSTLKRWENNYEYLYSNVVEGQTTMKNTVFKCGHGSNNYGYCIQMWSRVKQLWIRYPLKPDQKYVFSRQIQYPLKPDPCRPLNTVFNPQKTQNTFEYCIWPLGQEIVISQLSVLVWSCFLAENEGLDVTNAFPESVYLKPNSSWARLFGSRHLWILYSTPWSTPIFDNFRHSHLKWRNSASRTRVEEIFSGKCASWCV